MVNFKKYTQSGRSMIEMLGVLAIVGVLSAGGIAGYSMAMQSYKGTQLIERVNLIATRMRQVYKNSYDGSGALNTVLINSGKLTANDLKNPFGGDFAVGSDNAVSFYIIAYNLPADTCVDLLQTDWGSSGMVVRITVGGNEFQVSDGTYPPSLSSSISACKDGDNYVAWVLK